MMIKKYAELHNIQPLVNDYYYLKLEKSLNLLLFLYIARYAAHKFNLGGETLEEQAEADMLCEHIAYLFKEAKKSFNETTKDKSNNNEQELMNTMKLFEDRLNQTSSNGFLIGSKLTWADLFLANIFDIINRKSQVNLDKFPAIKKHRDAIKSLPNVIKYYNNNSD